MRFDGARRVSRGDAMGDVGGRADGASQSHDGSDERGGEFQVDIVEERHDGEDVLSIM